MQTPTAIIGPRHVERFQCLGSDCEDTCCRGAEFVVDADRLRRVLAAVGTAEERERVHGAVAPREGWGADPTRYGTLRPKEDGDCVFLDGRRRCEIRGRFGPELLWDACADYPRRAARTADRLEVSATLGCPEIARLALLDDDGADLVALDATRVPRGAPAPALDAEPARAYDRYLDDIRGTVLHVLTSRALPVPLRLFVLSVFGERTAEFFHQDVFFVDEMRLRDELLLARHPEVHANCRESFDALAPDAPALMARIAPVLVAVAGRRGLGELVAAILGGAGVPEGAGDEATARLLAARCEARRAGWIGHAARLDRVLANFAQAFWLHDWYTRSPNLQAHGQKLVARLALLQVLLFCHPRLDGDPWDPAAGAAFDAAAVDAAAKLERALERDAGFRERVEDLFAGPDGAELERLAIRG